jgi:hypothetical protein
MRDGIPVIALATAIVALLVALAGFVSRGPSEPHEPPEEILKQAEGRLKGMELQRQSMREDMAELRALVTRAVELAPARATGGADRAQIENAVKSAVDSALRKRLEKEAARVGAPPPKKTPQQEFEGMLLAIVKDLKFERNKMLAVRNVLGRLRDRLNQVYRSRTGSQRNREAGRARSKADADLVKILSPAEFQRFHKWRKSSRDSYVKKFFGL